MLERQNALYITLLIPDDKGAIHKFKLFVIDAHMLGLTLNEIFVFGDKFCDIFVLYFDLEWVCARPPFRRRGNVNDD